MGNPKCAGKGKTIRPAGPQQPGRTPLCGNQEPTGGNPISKGAFQTGWRIGDVRRREHRPSYGNLTSGKPAELVLESIIVMSQQLERRS
jgi:hypothetical protein